MPPAHPPARLAPAAQRAARLLLAGGDAEAAITPLQECLRADPRHAPTWEALGCAYQALGRLAAALKVRPASRLAGARTS